MTLKNMQNKLIDPVLILSAIAWVSLFILTWLILLNIISFDGIRISGWVFFFIIGIMSSAILSKK